jgi:hypothetical protein
MESWGVFFLGVIALASIVQAGFLIGLVVSGDGLRAGWTLRELDREISPALGDFNCVSSPPPRSPTPRPSRPGGLTSCSPTRSRRQ